MLFVIYLHIIQLCKNNLKTVQSMQSIKLLQEMGPLKCCTSYLVTTSFSNWIFLLFVDLTLCLMGTFYTFAQTYV